MSNLQLVSYILLTHQRPDYLPDCLESICAQTHRPIEVILVDNGNDLPPSFLTNILGDRVESRLIQPGQNLGVAAGRNLGMAHARGDVMVFIDDDARLNEPDATRRILDTLTAHPRCAAVAMHSVNPQGETIRSEVPLSVQDNPFRVGMVEVPYFVGCGVALRRDAVEKVGSYPARYFYCMEESDLSLRLLDAGYTILYDPEVLVTHFTATQGRVVHQGGRRTLLCSLNRARLAFRLMPFPYALTMVVLWFGRMLWLSRFNMAFIVEYIKTLIGERELLRKERRPISRRTIRYLRSIGGRVMF